MGGSHETEVEERENVTSVLIIDDHPFVLQGCRRLLVDSGITDVLEPGDVVAAISFFATVDPTSSL